MRPICEQRPLAGLLKAARKPIDQERPAVAKNVAAARKGLAAFLAAQAPKIAAQLADLLGLEKARRRPGGDEEALAAAAARARAALEALAFDDWDELAKLIEPTMEAMARDGAAAGLAQIGATSDEVVTLAGDKAAAWAEQRAAEMVGMRRNAAGDLVPNPDAKWRIDDSTREMLRADVETALQEGWSADDLASKLQDAHAFSDARAEAIARTEMAKADMAGAMEGYRVSGLVAGKTWSTSQDDLVSEECLACEAAGVVALDDDFPSGESAPPNHPNCRCTVLPVLNDEMPEAGKTSKDANMTKLWADITKSEKQDDGTIKVWGFASSEVVDSDGETITADAMRGARDGYMAFANVREMHDPKKAAGVAIEYEVQDDGRTWFGAHVVDPVAVLKVETGVYKGFSIGARVPPGGREGKVIKSIDLREVSLVDRPANPEATFTMFKADDSADQVKKGLYELRDFADVLRSIGYLAGSAEWEAQAEGDKSPLPASLRDWLAQGVVIFKAMAEEETSELMAQLKAMAPATMVVDTVAAAEAGGELQKAACQEIADVRAVLGLKNAEPVLPYLEDLIKAGKRFSRSTKDALAKIHGACKEASAHLDGLGYAEAEEEDEETGKAAAADDLQKRTSDEAAAVEEIAKAAGLTVAAPNTHELAKAALAELVTLRKAHDDLKAQAAPPKGYANAAGTLAKSEDRAGQQNNEPAPVVKNDGAIDDVATLVKAAQARPIRLS